MTKYKAFVTRQIPQAGLDSLASTVDLEVWPGELPPPYETLAEKVRQVDGLLCLVTDRIDRQLMESALPALKVISQMGVGIDNIDIQAATGLGIPVGNTPGVLTETTADFAWALLMAAARRVVEADKLTRAGGWKTWGPKVLLGVDIYGAVLGIVGFGRIGQAVARRGRGFGMRILYFDRSRELAAEEATGAAWMPFDRLLEEADFVTIHTSLNAETFHMFGVEQFARMKRSAILINTARGHVVDQVALYTALFDRTIAYAGIDVTEKEPISANDPLLTLDNLVIAPHIASGSLQARTKMALMAAENLLAGLRGERLPNCANPEVYR
jgi:glyoxylate reductase